MQDSKLLAGWLLLLTHCDCWQRSARTSPALYQVSHDSRYAGLKPSLPHHIDTLFLFVLSVKLPVHVIYAMLRPC